MIEHKPFLDLDQTEKNTAAKMAAALARRKKTPAPATEPQVDHTAVAVEMERHERERQARFEATVLKVNEFFDQLDEMADRGEFEQIQQAYREQGPALNEELDEFSGLDGYDEVLTRTNDRINAINRKELAAAQSRPTNVEPAAVEPPAPAPVEASERNIEPMLEQTNRIFADTALMIEQEDARPVAERMNPADLSTRSLAQIDSGLATLSGGNPLPPEVNTRLEERLEQYHARVQVYERRYNAEKAQAAAELKRKLDESREKYLKAKRRVEDSTGIKGLLGFIGKESKEKARVEHEEAQSEYNRLRAEYAADNVSLHLAEQRELLDKKLQELYPDKKGNSFFERINKVGNAIVEAYKWSGRVNLDSDRVTNKYAKVVLRGLNLRTVTMFGLTAGAVAYGGAVGGGIWALGRMIRGLGGAVTSYGLMERVREGAQSKKIEKNLNTFTKAELEQELGRVTASSMLAGEDISKLEQNDDYKKLQEKYDQLLSAEARSNLETYQKSSKDLEKAIEQALKSEKRAKVFMKAGAAAIGAFFASGIVSKGINKVMGGIGELAKNNNPFAGQTPLESHPVNIPKIAIAPEGINHPNPALHTEMFQVDAKGYEGDLLRDIKNGKLKLDWLKEHYSSKSTDLHANDPDRLVHRFMLDVEKQHPGDWDRISKGSYSIDKLTGEVKIGVDQTEFLPPKPEAVVEASTPPAEVPAFNEPLQPLGGNIPGEQFSIPKFEAPAEVPVAEADSDLDFEGDGSQAAASKTLQETREALAFQQEKTSAGLNYLLGNDYDRFLKQTIGVAARNIDKIQNLSYNEFLANMNDEKFAKTYGKLGQILTKVPNLEGIRMRDIILKLGQAQAENNLKVK